MTISDERLAEMLAGLEGVTQGPWDNIIGTGIIKSDRHDGRHEVARSDLMWGMNCSGKNAAHIARCDPDTIRSLIEELQTLRATADTEQDGKGVKVKGLEWRYYAESNIGAAEWLAVQNINGQYFRIGRVTDGWKYDSAFYADIEEAKAAAQADYRQRILSTLSNATQHEAVAWRGANYLRDARQLMAEAKERVKPIVGGPEGETIMAYEMPTGLWLMLQANVRNLLDTLPPPASPAPSQDGVVTEDQGYLVWSNEHRAWWRANSQGYARSILEAGRYSRTDSVDISEKSRSGWSLNERPDEIAVAIADLPAPIRAALEAALNNGGE